MIKIAPRSDTPTVLDSARVAELKAELQRKIEAGEPLKKADFDSKVWRDDEVLNAIYNMHHGKCCYCERKRDMKRESDVEHFRPKGLVTERDDHPGYWWLAYKWSNYLYSCKKCNQSHKKNQFPVANEDTRAFDPNDPLENETPLLVNPVTENPESFISFEWAQAYGVFVKAVGVDSDGRGSRTVKITGINEGEIPRERAELVKGLEEIATTMKAAIRKMSERFIDETAIVIREQTSSKRKFAGFRRAFFRGQGLGEYIATD